MLRVLIALATFVAVLVNAAHVEAHASGQHSHEVAAVDVSHSHHDEGGDQSDDAATKAEHKADHAPGHNHVVGDRSAMLGIGRPSYIGTDADHPALPDLTLPSALRAPLLEPPSA